VPGVRLCSRHDMAFFSPDKYESLRQLLAAPADSVAGPRSKCSTQPSQSWVCSLAAFQELGCVAGLERSD